MNRDDILIVCALPEETQNKLEDYSVLYTGVGKINATFELQKYLTSWDIFRGDPKLVINYGTAGSDDIPIHTLVDCTKFTQRDMDASGL